MCGIAGYVGYKLADTFVLDILEKLEYRGYDSAGVSYIDGNKLSRLRVLGGVKNLYTEMRNTLNASSIEIGHTRWATHGRVSINNAHPQMDNDHTIAVVHNGIIENFEELKQELISSGVVFESQTDTEIIPNLIEHELKGLARTEYNILHGLSRIITRLNGSFALCVLVQGCDKMFVAARISPLIISKLSHGCLVASDVSAMPIDSPKYKLPDNHIAVLSRDDFVCYDIEQNVVKLNSLSVSVDADDDRLGEYSSYMQKEIAQAADAVSSTASLILNTRILDIIDINRLTGADKIVICACGTALHAGRVLSYLLESECSMQSIVDYASELKYRPLSLTPKSVCFFISQSGETADTLAYLEIARSHRAYCIGITNVMSSRMVDMVDVCIPTSAGGERAVASTKAYMAQLCSIFMLVDKLCGIYHHTSHYDYRQLSEVVQSLNEDEHIPDDLLAKLSTQASLYILGRGIDYISAMEGALKIKEVSYIHCEAMPLGELKHGSLALFNANTYCIVLMTQPSLYKKALNNIFEIRSRGAKVVLITNLDADLPADYVIHIASTNDAMSIFKATKVLQTLALEIATLRGCNVDKPRNLAKSVTVE